MAIKIKKTKKLIKQLQPYWKKLKELRFEFDVLRNNLETKMEKETGIKGIEFFMCDNSYIGIGNAERTMRLINSRELE